MQTIRQLAVLGPVPNTGVLHDSAGDLVPVLGQLGAALDWPAAVALFLLRYCVRLARSAFSSSQVVPSITVWSVGPRCVKAWENAPPPTQRPSGQVLTVISIRLVCTMPHAYGSIWLPWRALRSFDSDLNSDGPYQMLFSAQRGGACGVTRVRRRTSR